MYKLFFSYQTSELYFLYLYISIIMGGGGYMNKVVLFPEIELVHWGYV